MTKATLFTTLDEGDESDLSDDEGSSSFNAALAIVGNEYPALHEGIALAQGIELAKDNIDRQSDDT